MKVTAKDIICLALVVFTASYGIWIRFGHRVPSKEDNRLERKYDSLNVVLTEIKHSNEILLLSLQEKQDTINALNSELEILKTRRQRVDSLHYMVNTDIIIDQVRIWADRYVANGYAIPGGVDLVSRPINSR